MPFCPLISLLSVIRVTPCASAPGGAAGGLITASGDNAFFQQFIIAIAGQLREPSGNALIDVRGPDEYTGPLGHIGAALNIPVAELPGRLIEIKAFKDRPVILVCRTDKRSANAAKLLPEAAFRDVHVLRGGMERWSQNGLPVEGGGDI